ncbi:MAG: hypothetical protein HY020_02970 [Burkholderiales bacterium]|nr:hypothetical protein [Burkholderiales bacterium]
MIESFLKLVEPYPLWARVVIVAALIAVGVVLVFGRHSVPEVEVGGPAGPVFLRINGISLYPDDPDAEIQIVSSVNRTEYKFPSVAGVKWMRVGPAMSKKIIQLPEADSYEIWFTMNYKSGKVARNQETVTIYSDKQHALAAHASASVPYSGSYKLYPIKSDIASSAIVAVVYFELTHSGQ